FFFLFQAEDGIRDFYVTGVQTCALPIFGEACAGDQPHISCSYYCYVHALMVLERPFPRFCLKKSFTAAVMRFSCSSSSSVLIGRDSTSPARASVTGSAPAGLRLLVYASCRWQGTG